MTTAIFLLFIALFAISEAWRDGAAIARHEPINHGKGLLFRLAICGIFFGCASALHWLAAHDFRFMLFATMGWAAFTMLFRFVLNMERGLDWRYVSTSNVYDRFFLWECGGHTYDSAHRLSYNHPAPSSRNHYRRCVHRAGTLAYAFEATVLLASAITFFALR